MAVIQKDQKKLLKVFDERRLREFLTVAPQPGKKGATISVKPSAQRVQDWCAAFEKSSICVTDWNIEDDDVVVFRFNNGLKISDYGYHVSFSATEGKDKVEMNSAINIVDCAARHLNHCGWKHFDVVSLRDGGLTFLSAFSNAYPASPKEIMEKLWMHSMKVRGAK